MYKKTAINAFRISAYLRLRTISSVPFPVTPNRRHNISTTVIGTREARYRRLCAYRGGCRCLRLQCAGRDTLCVAAPPRCCCSHPHCWVRPGWPAACDPATPSDRSDAARMPVVRRHRSACQLSPGEHQKLAHGVITYRSNGDGIEETETRGGHVRALPEIL
jgi:hypothetical protein